MPQSSPIVPEEIENSLCQIREVKAARIITKRDNTIDEVHILASPEKNPKQLVRDIESLLMAEYGLPVNHRKISIAQTGVGKPEKTEDKKEAELFEKGKKTEEIKTRGRGRPKIVSINTQATGLHTTVTVRLELNNVEYEGMAKGPATQTGRIRLVSLATLDAIEKFTRGAANFALEDVDILSLGRERVVAACVMLVTQLGEEVFTGSAAIKHNENDSIVRATLDAINRRFTYLTLQNTTQ